MGLGVGLITGSLACRAATRIKSHDMDGIEGFWAWKVRRADGRRVLVGIYEAELQPAG